MGLKNRINSGYLYYLTLTVIDWVDVFTRPGYKHILLDAIRYCQKEKNLSCGLKSMMFVTIVKHDVEACVMMFFLF